MTVKKKVVVRSPISCSEAGQLIKFPIKSVAPPKKVKPIPGNMDFPTLDDLEMDMPLLNEHMTQLRNFPEDNAEFEMDCLKHFIPSLPLSSLDL